MDTATTIDDGPLPRVDPEEVGLSTTRLSNIGAALMREVGSGRIPGAVVGIARGGQLAWLEGVGYRDPDMRAPMMSDAVFSIASMTKPLVSTLIMQLVEEGVILLADPVDVYLPELANLRVQMELANGSFISEAIEAGPTIYDLLRHTAGFTYRDRGTTPAHEACPGSSISAPVQHSRTEFLNALADAPLVFQPGTAWEYGFSTDVLGLVAEAATGQTLATLLSERIFEPIGMVDTGFQLEPERELRYARPFADDPLTGAPQSTHHIDASEMNWDSGGGGALSTAWDYLRFLHVFRSLGAFGDRRILSRKSIEMMTVDHLGGAIESRIADTMDPTATGYGFGLGFAVRKAPGGSPLYGTARDYYWSGVYGTYFWCDPVEDLTVVFMCASPGAVRLRYRQLIRALVYQAISD